MKRFKYYVSSVMIIIVFLIGCTNKAEVDEAVGKYYFVYERAPLHYYDDLDYIMTLDGYGKGEWKREDKIHNIKYTLNGNNIKIEDKLTGIYYNGTVSDGQLHLYDGDPNDMMVTEYMFEVKR